VLAIRVGFTDTPIESSTTYYDRQLLFLSQYWNQVSDGQVVLQTTLLDSVFTLPRPMSYYGDDDHFQERLVHLVRDVVQVSDSTVDYRPVQSLIIFHAGGGQEADVFDDSRNQIWSAFVTPEDFDDILPDTTGLGRVGIATNDTISPGVPRMIAEAVEVPEHESQDGYAFGLMGVVAHEFGHQLGRLQGQISMPDLYDTDGEAGGSSQGIGGWCIMGGGVWIANGFVPGGPCAWTKFWLGFLAPTRVTSDGPQSLARLEGSLSPAPRALQIPITQSEYFLLENRDRDPDRNGTFTFDDVDGDGCFDYYEDSFAGAEFDFFLPANRTEPDPTICDPGTYVSGSGVMIYHVDDATIEAGIRSNTVNTEAFRKGVDVEEADGIQDLDYPPSSLNAESPDDVFRAGWRDRFTPDTSPSTSAYPDERTGISVTDISAADSVMTLNVSFDRTRSGWPKVLTGRIRSLPSVASDLDGDGSLEIVVPIQRLNNTGAIFVFRQDGNDFLDGDATPTAFATTPSAPSSSPCVGDIDGVAGSEIVFQTLDGAIYAFHTNGTEVLDGDANPSTLGVLAPPAGITAQRSQPILVDLNGDNALEIVLGGSANPLGSSTLRAIRVSGGTRTIRTRSMGGATEGAPAAADLDGDGLPEVIVANTPTNDSEFSASGLSIVNWDFLNDNSIPDDFTFFLIQSGGPYSAPVLADLDRSGVPEIVVADGSGAYHAFHALFDAHAPSEPPNSYIRMNELPGWPSKIFDRGRTSEVSIGDLEREGYPEVIHTGTRCASRRSTGTARRARAIRFAPPLRSRTRTRPGSGHRSSRTWTATASATSSRSSRMDAVPPIAPTVRRSPPSWSWGAPARGRLPCSSTSTGTARPSGSRRTTRPPRRPPSPSGTPGSRFRPRASSGASIETVRPGMRSPRRGQPLRPRGPKT
jgi:M6 family metalloprotease-like protein